MVYNIVFPPTGFREHRILVDLQKGDAADMCHRQN